MIARSLALALVVSTALSTAACSSAETEGLAGPSALVGRWTRPVAEHPPIVVNLTYQFNADGSAAVSARGADGCSGAITSSNLQWSATATELSLIGTPDCAGRITCSAKGASESYGCEQTGVTSGAGTTRYQLANDKLSFSGDTYVRE